MAESIAEQILAGLKTELEAITGDDGTTYWYSPHVVRVDYFEYREHFKTGYGDYLYLIRNTGDESERADMATMGGMASALDVFVMLAARDTRGDRDPFTASTNSGTIRERMIKDVRTALESDVTRGLSGSGWQVLDTSAWSIRRDFIEPEGWILAEVHFIVTYEYTRGSP